MKKVKIEKFIQPLGVVSPSQIMMKKGLYFSYWFNDGIMQQKLQEIEQQRGKLPSYCFDYRTTAHPVVEIAHKHWINKRWHEELWR